MTSESLDRESAKIFQFPRGRDGRDDRRGDHRLAIDEAPDWVEAALCSGSWYHEAAIQEAKPKRER